MKRLVLDIETAPITAFVWGNYEQNISKTLEDWFVLGVGYKWMHTGKAEWKGLPDFPLYKKEPRNDRELMKFTHALLNEADVVITQNGISFDMKKLRSRFLVHGLPPINEPKQVDTKRILKKHFSFASNKLDDIARQLFGDSKLKHDGIEMWWGCMNGDLKMWKRMGDYCKKDVLLTARLYETLLPYIDNHPNWNLYGDRPNCCPNCGHAGIRKCGFRYNVSTVQQKYVCGRCKHIFSGESVKRTTLKG